MWRSLLAGVLLGIYPAAAIASTVSGVTGTLTNGQTITVAGSDFGANGPTVVLWEDFEAGANGAAITSGSPSIGTWDFIQAAPVYSATYKVGGDLSGHFFANREPEATNETFDTVGAVFSAGQRYVFWSSWFFMPTGAHISGCGGEGCNWKRSWVAGADTWTDDDIFVATNEDLPAVGSRIAFSVAGNNQVFNPDPTRYYTTEFRANQWMREEVWIDAGTETADGSVLLWEFPWYTTNDSYNSTGQMLRMTQTAQNVLRASGCTTEPCGVFERLNFNAYNRPDSRSNHYYDDIYIAVGANARARVEISSAQTWGDNAHAADLSMSICTPTSWSASSVACTLRQGRFASNASVYLFVISADGTISDQDGETSGAQGYALTLGASEAAQATFRSKRVRGSRSRAKFTPVP